MPALGIANGVLDRLVAEIVLNGPRIMPGIGKRKAATVAQHVSMDRNALMRFPARAL